MHILIRRATLADTENIQNLIQIAYAPWAAMTGCNPLPTLTHTEIRETHIVDLLEDGGQLCGVIELVPEDDYLLIENIAVHPNQQGKGLGHLLLEHAETSACVLGFVEIRLYTNAAFTSNLIFYAAHGYAELERSIMIPGSITVHMNKMLEGDV